MLRGFTKPRNRSTLRARQSGNLTFNRRAWPKGLCPPLSRHLARSGGLSLTFVPPAALPSLVQRCQVASRHSLLFRVTLHALAGAR